MKTKHPSVPLDQIHLSKASGAREEVALESTMQSLALDTRSPLALELVATAREQHFLLRSPGPLARRHLAQQIQARYPQVRISPAPTDPLALGPHEECSMVELRPGAASYLPLRSWKPRELLAEGTDPLLGLLGACRHVPERVRVIAHLALLPASPTWSAAHRRRAVEHPLAKEQERTRLRQRDQTPNPVGIIPLILLVLIILFLRAHPLHLPGWVAQAWSSLLHGHFPHLSSAQMWQVVGVGLAALAVLVVLVSVLALLGRLFGGAAIYDQHLVDEKTARPAYRVRLHLVAITTLPHVEEDDEQADQPVAPSTPQVIETQEDDAEQTHAHWWVRPAAGARAVRVVCVKLWQDARTGFIHVRKHVQGQVLSVQQWFSSSPQERQAGRTLCQQQRRVRRAERHQERQAGRALRQQRRRVRRAKRRQARQRKQERREVLQTLSAAYRQYHLASGAFFRVRRLSARRASRDLRVVSGQVAFWPLRWWLHLRISTHLLSVADLAVLWHLPQAQDLPNLGNMQPAQSRTLPVASALTTGEGYPIGTSRHAGQVSTVFLPATCLRQNMLAVASTGKGKSTLFFLLAQAYLRAKAAGESTVGGFVGIDPHGDFLDLLLGCLPPDLEDLVEVVDLADRAFPVGLNPLDLSAGQDRDKVVDTILQVIAALWDLDEAPRTRNVLEYACKTLAEANLALLRADPHAGPDRQYTLLDIVPLLRQEHFRHALMEQLDGDPLLRDWWEHYYERLDSSQQADFSASVVTRLSKFASTRISRRIVGQPRSTLDLAEVIRQEKILVLKGASGDVGSDLATLMISLIAGFFHITLAEQARLAPNQRRRFFVLIDEFQTLAGIDYQTMLAELRKYGGSFALATQSLTYLDRLDHGSRTLRATVLSNIDHLFAFAMSGDDARLLHLDGVGPEDITGLPDYECYARLSLHGRRLPLFSLRLFPAPQPDAQQQQRVRERSQQRAGRRPVEDVDALLEQSRLRQLTLKPEPKKRHKRGEYDGYEYQPALSTEPEPPKKERGERKRGKSRPTEDEPEERPAAGNPPRHTMYEAASSESAQPAEEPNASQTEEGE